MNQTQNFLMDSVSVSQKSMFDRAMQRPENYETLSPGHQWEIDKQLGILDWYGNCDHNEFIMCPDCKKKWKTRFSA